MPTQKFNSHLTIAAMFCIRLQIGLEQCGPTTGPRTPCDP